MPRETKFNYDWLRKKDADGIELIKWLKQGEKTGTFQCTLWKIGDLACSTQRWGAVSQHMGTKGDLANMKLLKNNSTFLIASPRAQTSSSDDIINIPYLRLSSIQRPLILDFQEQVTKAEAVWALTVAQRGYSFNSCDEIGDVFRTLFPDSNIAKQFNMQLKKISCFISRCGPASSPRTY